MNKKLAAGKGKKLDSGYTFIELLVVMVIMGIILVFGFSSFQQFTQRQIVKSASKQLVNDLNAAQNMATNGNKPANCTNLDGYSVITVAGGSNIYNVTANCVDVNGVPETCTGMDCTKQVVLPVGMTVQPVPGVYDVVTFYSLNRGTNIDPHNDMSYRIFSNDYPGTEYIITVNKSGSISE